MLRTRNCWSFALPLRAALASGYQTYGGTLQGTVGPIKTPTSGVRHGRYYPLPKSLLPRHGPPLVHLGWQSRVPVR